MHLNVSRFQAFIIHLFVSSAILSIFLLLVLFVWYPQPFFELEGLIDIVWVLVGVDVVLGPAFTLLIFRPGKPGLKRDLSVIAGIQIIAFIYGAHTFYIERPVMAILSDLDFFQIIRASELKDKGVIVDKAFFSSPEFNYLEMPTNNAVLKQILEEIENGAPTFVYREEYHRPLAGYLRGRYNAAWELSRFEKDPVANAEIIRAKQKFGERMKDFLYFPILGKVTSKLLIIDRKTEA
ncbi:MAG: hypothetical protein OEX07_12740, partial [Gammaproteobacteria bacterium]|nr:hypothetical protein [Gammaproteobacteria bacterium]